MKVLVTGGGGFLGGAVVRRLRARGDTVISYTRSAYPWLQEIGVVEARGDLADLGALEAACRGCDAVVHVAAKAGVWGRKSEYYATNVIGTRNVIEACRSVKVPRLIYTSTPSVVHTGVDILGGNESMPYAPRHEAHYTATKAEAERAVLAANSATLSTVSLRPHLIWGPGDPHLIPRLLRRARQGRLKRVGTRDIIVDVTYIDNAADAHILALDKVSPTSAAAGKAYFITNGEPLPMWEFLNRVLAAAGLPAVTASVPVWFARNYGRFAEGLHRLFLLSGEPAMTRFVATQLSTSHWFDISAARRDLGYDPRVSVEEGLRRMAPTIVSSL